MSKDMGINLKEAARSVALTSSQLLYYISNNRGPEYEIIAGCKVFKPTKVKKWKKSLRDKRKKGA